MQPEPSKKAHADVEKRRKSLNAVRIQQHTAQLLMRQMQLRDFDSDTNPVISWMNLQDGEFVELATSEQKRLPVAITVLRMLLQEKNATERQLRAALTAAQFAAYKNSFTELHILPESDWQHRPDEIDEYLKWLKLGDLLFGASERVSALSAKSKYGIRRNSRGVSKASELWYKAEKYYEEALMYLSGECENTLTAARLQSWFDRELSFEYGVSKLSPDPDSMPRLRGSRSHYCLDKTRNLWGVKKSIYYRQVETVSEAVYAMLFDEREFELQDMFIGEIVKQLIAKRNAQDDGTATSNTDSKLPKLLQSGLDVEED